MNAVSDQLGLDVRIGEHLRDHAGVTVPKWPHRVEHVGGLPHSKPDGAVRFFERGVGVPHRGHDIRAEHLLDQLRRVGQLGCDGHDAQLAASGLREVAVNVERRLDKQIDGVDAASLWVQIRPLHVNTERVRHRARLRGLFNGVGEKLDRLADVGGCGGAGRRVEGGGPEARQGVPDRVERLRRRLHHVCPARAMVVNVNEPRRDGAAFQAHLVRAGRQFDTRAGCCLENAAVFNQHDAVRDRVRRVDGVRDECGGRHGTCELRWKAQGLDFKACQRQSPASAKWR